jgi:hypothetical protein
VFAIFVSHHSSALLRVICLMTFLTQLTAVLQAGSWFSATFSELPMVGIAYFRFITHGLNRRRVQLFYCCVRIRCLVRIGGYIDTARWPHKAPFSFQNKESLFKVQRGKCRKLNNGMEYAFGQNME